jgi:protein phosphatase
VISSLNLFAVADGMGGHAGGEVAATIATLTLRSAFDRQPTAEGLVQAVREANRSVWQRSQLDANLYGMGTTLASVALVGGQGSDRLALANVGDSRIYLWRSGKLTQLTVDHSVAEELALRGELTAAEAAIHPHRHILTRALGINPEVEVDAWEVHPFEGDRYLVCSDGLCNEVIDEEIAQVLREVRDPQTAAERLVALALGHGGNDNVSVLVVDVLVGDALVGDADVPDGAITATPVEVPEALAAAGIPVPPAGSVAEVPGAPPMPDAPDPPAPSSGVLISSTARSGNPVSVVPPVRMSRSANPGLLAVSRRRSRLVTFRTLLFALLFAAIVGGPWYLIRWYVLHSYFVGVSQEQIVIYQGRPGGFLWYQPKVVENTHVALGSIEQYEVPVVRADVQEPSLAQARTYVANLVQQAASLAPGPASVPTTTTSTFLGLPAEGSVATGFGPQSAGGGI